MMVLRFVRSVTFNTFRPLDSARKGCVSPPPAVFALGTPRFMLAPQIVAIYLPMVKAPIDKALSFTSALVIPNVYPDNQHV